MLSSDNDAAPAPGLPLLCYARHPETGATVLIVRGEDGYHPVRTFLTPGQLNSALAEPPTAAQVRAMLVGSMFSWQVPAAGRTRTARTTMPVPITLGTILSAIKRSHQYSAKTMKLFGLSPGRETAPVATVEDIRLDEAGVVAETPCVCGCCRWVGGEIKPNFGSSPTDTDGQGGAVPSGMEPRP